jgi:hypothetical protein
MSRVRFATVQALLETFPEVARQIGTAPAEQPPVEFLRSLATQRKFAEAVIFCAHLLPRREAVWWGCGCARALLGEIPPNRWEGLLAAETWVERPDDEHRTAALEIGTKGDENDPLTWLARAAGWSGGFWVATAEMQVPVPPYMTARLAGGAILACTATLGPPERESRLRSCVAEGIKLAETGLG